MTITPADGRAIVRIEMQAALKKCGEDGTHEAIFDLLFKRGFKPEPYEQQLISDLLAYAFMTQDQRIERQARALHFSWVLKDRGVTPSQRYAQVFVHFPGITREQLRAQFTPAVRDLAKKSYKKSDAIGDADKKSEPVGDF